MIGKCYCCGYFTEVKEYKDYDDKKSDLFCDVCAYSFLSQMYKYPHASTVETRLTMSIGFLVNSMIDASGIREEFKKVMNKQSQYDNGEIE